MPADREELLRRMAATPRENGDAVLGETAAFLSDVLREAGLTVELVPFAAYPLGARLLGVFVLLCGGAYVWALLRGRWQAALGVAVVLPVVIVLEGELGVPLLGWFGSAQEHNVIATLPVADATQRLILSAHYDTKTDLFDHVVRTPVFMLALPAVVLLVIGAVGARPGRWEHRPRLRTSVRRLALGTGVGYCPAAFLALSGGMFVDERSRGAIDDGAACIVLVEIARELAQAPPTRTQIVFAFFAAEELGAAGAKAWVDATLVDPSLPTAAINLDPIGASTELAIIGKEKTLLRGYEPDGDIVTLLEEAYAAQTGRELEMTPLGGTTDGVAYRRRGIPAATLMSSVPPFRVPRGLHSQDDGPDRLAPGALEFTRDYLREVVRRFDGS